MENRLKINAKTIKNLPKIWQKWTKNQSWRGLGRPLGALGGQDRKNTNAMRTFGASWGHLGAVLGASWGRLGAWIAVLGRLGALLSRLKIDVKIDQKIDGIGFSIDFGGFLKEKWKHVGTKIEQKSMPTSKSDFLKKLHFSVRKTMILKVQGIEVGGKNQ